MYWYSICTRERNQNIPQSACGISRSIVIWHYPLLCLDRINSCSMTETRNASPNLRYAIHCSTSNLVFVLLVVSNMEQWLSPWPNHAHSRSRDDWHCQDDHSKHPRSFLPLISTTDFVKLASSHLWFVSPIPLALQPPSSLLDSMPKNEVSDLGHWLSM